MGFIEGPRCGGAFCVKEGQHMIELKEHNRKPYEELSRKLEDVSRVGFISATGTGKSYVGGKYVEENRLEGRTLILVPSDAIREGWKILLPEATILTYQSLLNSSIDSSSYSLIICDEVHHLGAGKWGAEFKKLTEGYNGKILGMSATPVRFLDNSRDMVEEVLEGNRVVGVELPEAIDMGILPSFDYISALYTIPKINNGTSKAVKKGAANGAKERAGGGVKKESRNGLTEKLYKKLDLMENEYSFQAIMAKHMKPGTHKVAVFVPSIPEIEKYMGIVRGIYPDALHLACHSKMTGGAIKAVVRRFEEADQTAFIYTVDLLNEGVHIDGVDTIIMFRRTESPTVFLQQLGRALTTNQADGRITVFDFVANHMNLKSKHDGAGNVIDWVTEGIENPERQIIRADYAKEEWEVLDQLRELLSRQWTEEEDCIVQDNYNKPDHIAIFKELIPNRTWGQIQSRAGKLGLRKTINQYPDGLLEVVKQVYPTKGARGVIELFPQLTLEQVMHYAKRHSIKKRGPVNRWTESEIEILRQNKEKTGEELLALLPERSLSQIRLKRSVLGLSKKRAEWSDEKDEVIRNHPELTPKRLKEDFLPEMSVDQIIGRKMKLLGKTDKRILWSTEEDEILRTNYNCSDQELSELLPKRTINAIQARRVLLGLPTATGKLNKKWTEEEKQFVANYPLEELTALLPGRTEGAIRQMKQKIRQIKTTGGTKCEN